MFEFVIPSWIGSLLECAAVRKCFNLKYKENLDFQFRLLKKEGPLDKVPNQHLINDWMIMQRPNKDQPHSDVTHVKCVRFQMLVTSHHYSLFCCLINFLIRSDACLHRLFTAVGARRIQFQLKTAVLQKHLRLISQTTSYRTDARLT